MKTITPEPFGVEEYDDQVKEIIAICARAGYEVSASAARLIWGDYSYMISGKFNHWEPLPAANRTYKTLSVMLAFCREDYGLPIILGEGNE